MVIASMALVPSSDGTEEENCNPLSMIASNPTQRESSDWEQPGTCNDKKQCVKDNKNCMSIFTKGGLKEEQQLKRLVSLQLGLIEHQQSSIMRKDRQIISLKSEKDQLEARLGRMERRLALQKRHSLDPDEFPIKSKSSGAVSRISTPTSYSSKNPTITEADKNAPALPVNVNSRSDRNFRFSSYLRTNKAFLHMSTKLNLKVDDIAVKDEETEKSVVSVPPWKLVAHQDKPVITGDNEEDISNDAFARRHLKPETEEKKRKRWDLQHLRQQRHHEMLSRKYNERQINKTQAKTASCNSVSNTLDRDPSNVMAIEISDIVPVCAFGRPLPAVEVKEMELPWFSIAKREVQLRSSKERVSKRLKTSHKKGPLKKQSVIK